MNDMSKYNESVIIPYLQKKYQELSNQNMVLEVNLLMERQKNAELESVACPDDLYVNNWNCVEVAPTNEVKPTIVRSCINGV